MFIVCHHGRAIAIVHPVNMMNVERRQAAADPNPNTTTYAVSPPVGCQSLHPPSPDISITQPKIGYSFYRPTEGRRQSRSGWLVTYRQWYRPQ